MAAALGTYAGMINTGALAQLDFMLWDDYTLNQFIWLLGFAVCIGISAGLLVGSGSSLQSTISELEGMAKTSMNAGDKEWARQKEYAKTSVMDKVNMAKNSILAKVKSLFSKKNSRDVNAAVLETDFKVLSPSQLVSKLQGILLSVRSVLQIQEIVETDLVIPEPMETVASEFSSQKKAWASIIVALIAVVAVVIFNFAVSAGGIAV